MNVHVFRAFVFGSVAHPQTELHSVLQAIYRLFILDGMDNLNVTLVTKTIKYENHFGLRNSRVVYVYPPHLKIAEETGPTTLNTWKTRRIKTTMNVT